MTVAHGVEALVLAGGFGTRLQSVVPDLPKPMAPVAGRPFLEILLASLAKKGVGRAVLSLGYRAEIIQRHFGRSYAGIEIACRTEATPLGTGGALRYAMAACRSPRVLVVNGDTFLDLELDALLAASPADDEPVIVGRALPDTTRFGRLQIDAANRITGFVEKGAGGPGVINSGHYLLPRTLFDDTPALPEAFSFETDFLPAAVERRAFKAFVTRGAFIDIGVPEDYRRAQSELAAFAA